MKQMFFWNSLAFFYDPTDTGNLISGSSAFSKSNLYIWKFLVHILLKPSLKDFEHYLPCMWNECSCAVVWTFFGIAFLWNENWPFPVLLPLLSFPNFESVHCFCLILTFASWLAYRFLRKQVRESGIIISFRIFQFSVIHTVKGFSVVNEAGAFVEFSCFFYDPNNVGSLISWFLCLF